MPALSFSRILVAALFTVIIYSTTQDLNAAVFGFDTFFIGSLTIEAELLARKLESKKFRPNVETLERLPDYLDSARNSITRLAQITGLTLAFTFFNYNVRWINPVLPAVLSDFLFSTLWAVFVWERYLMRLKRLKASIKRVFDFSILVYAAYFIVTGGVGALLAKFMGVPQLWDTLAFSVPFLFLAVMTNSLTTELAGLYRITSLGQSLAEIERHFLELVKSGSVAELEQTGEMVQVLQASVSKIEELRTKWNEEMGNSARIRAYTEEQKRIYQEKVSTSTKDPTLQILCNGSIFKIDMKTGWLQRPSNIPGGVEEPEFDEKLAGKLTRAWTIMVKIQESKQSVRFRDLWIDNWFHGMAWKVIAPTIEGLYEKDAAVWLTTTSPEERAKELAQVNLHLTFWEVDSAWRCSRLLEETMSRLETALEHYPTCELAALYSESLSRLVEYYREEERLWIRRVEVSRDWGEINSRGKTLARTAEAALHTYRKKWRRLEDYQKK